MMLALFMAAAMASGGGTAQPKLNCTDPVTQTDMTICAVRDFGVADAALNAQWKITAAAMKETDRIAKPDDGDPTYHQALLNAQRAWLSYRDGHCTSVGFYARGGTLQPMLVAMCRADLTRERTKQLKALTEQ